ncbi:MAG: PorT family protein [Flavobacteriales bacterium]|jgi:hypothetical protein|nr:PorT family protein [Flavobacteriales bacterium]
MKTIKTTILGLIFFASINSIMAQELSFGAKGGINYTTIANTDNSNGIGYHIGGLVDIGLSDVLNFRTELLLSNRRIAFTEKTEVFNVKTEISGSANPLYIAIPILYHYDINDNLSFMAGPQLSFIASNSSKFTTKTTVGSLDPVETKSTSSSTNGMRSMELGIALGGEYNLSENLGLGLRYVRGLQTKTDFDNAEDFQNILQLSAAYKF